MQPIYDCVVPKQASSLADLSSAIKQRALAEGLDKVGIVPAHRLDSEAQRLQEWLARKYHAGMQWMARAPSARVDPRAIFPQAQSVIVVVINYYTPSKHNNNSTSGKVSRYARGDD